VNLSHPTWSNIPYRQPIFSEAPKRLKAGRYLGLT